MPNDDDDDDFSLLPGWKTTDEEGSEVAQRTASHRLSRSRASGRLSHQSVKATNATEFAKRCQELFRDAVREGWYRLADADAHADADEATVARVFFAQKQSAHGVQ